MGGSTSSKGVCSRWRIKDGENRLDGMSDWVDVYGKSKPMAPFS